MEVGHDCFSGAFELVLYLTAYNKILRDVFEWICMQLTVQAVVGGRDRLEGRSNRIGTEHPPCYYARVLPVTGPLAEQLKSDIREPKPKPQEPNKLLPSSA